MLYKSPTHLHMVQGVEKIFIHAHSQIVVGMISRVGIISYEKKSVYNMDFDWSKCLTILARVWNVKFHSQGYRHAILQTDFLGSKIGGLPTRLDIDIEP